MSETSPEIDELVALMRSTFAEANGTDPVEPVDPDEIVFETLRAFLERKLPKSESLVGVSRDGTNLLPRFGWVMPWGREGCGKTSVLVDLLFHAAAGIDWLVYPVERAVRIVCVINEGIPGGLQDKFRQKVEAWEGDVAAVLDNLAIYVSPWGEFSFRDSAIVEHAHAFVRDFGADYVALDPLHTFGTSGAGTPQETEEFKHMLRRFGLWDDLGVLSAHHANKAGMVSGDWARHPDTVLHLEKDGKNAATKVTLQKARPADPHELGVPVILKWVVDSLGFERQTLPGSIPIDETKALAEILDRLVKTTSPVALDPLVKQVEGAMAAKREVVKAAIARGEIVNLAPVAEAGKRQLYRLVLPEMALTSENADVRLFEEDENPVVEPNTSVATFPTFPESQPEAEDERRTSSLSLERRRSCDVPSRADDDANPLLDLPLSDQED